MALDHTCRISGSAELCFTSSEFVSVNRTEAEDKERKFFLCNTRQDVGRPTFLYSRNGITMSIAALTPFHPKTSGSNDVWQRANFVSRMSQTRPTAARGNRLDFNA